jgi:hypothetical protein
VPVTPITLWPELHRLVGLAATRFGTPRHVIVEPLLPRYRPKLDGTAYRPRGACPTLYVRVHRAHRPRQTLAVPTILASFVHELAHLGTWRENPDHGPKWWDLTCRVAGWMRSEGYDVSTSLRHGSHPYSSYSKKRRK